MSDLRRTDLVDTGPATGRPRPSQGGHGGHAPETEEFDREINIRSIVWLGVGLVITALVVHLFIWWMLKGIRYYDDRRDTPLTPVEAANPQPQPPAPRLQPDVVTDMSSFLANERQREDHAAWVDRNQGSLRLPLGAAMDLIVKRGVAPLAAAPAGGVAGNPQGSAQPGGQQPGATMQNALPKAPAQPAPGAAGGGQGPGR
jgi:hypothetical protein